MKLAVLLVATTSCAVAKELSGLDWDKETAGKQVFVKFQAPW